MFVCARARVCLLVYVLNGIKERQRDRTKTLTSSLFKKKPGLVTERTRANSYDLTSNLVHADFMAQTQAYSNRKRPSCALFVRTFLSFLKQGQLL